MQSLILVCVAQVSAAPSEESFRFNPLLDQSPALNTAPPGRRWVDAISGLQAGISGGVYLGAVRSDLTEEYSTLRSGSRAMVGFELGYRLKLPLMFSLETDLGFGEALEEEGQRTSALDLFIRPKVSYDFIDSVSGGVYVGLGAAAGAFNLSEGKLGQSGLGGTLSLGSHWRFDQQSRLALELTWWPLYNSFAFRYRLPTEEELEENPALSRVKITGAWMSVFFIQLSYRLSDL